MAGSRAGCRRIKLSDRDAEKGASARRNSRGLIERFAAKQ